MAVFCIALYLQQNVLAMIALGVIFIFFVIFVGAERWEKFFKTMEMMFCVMNENRLRLYTGVILAIFVFYLLVLQYQSLSRPAEEENAEAEQRREEDSERQKAEEKRCNGEFFCGSS